MMIQMAVTKRVDKTEKMSSGRKRRGGAVGSASSSKKKTSAVGSIDDKERADRIAAAEAMSCLSSVILLPSDSDQLAKSITESGQIAPKLDFESSRKSKGSRSASKGKTRTKSTANQRNLQHTRVDPHSITHGETQAHTSNRKVVIGVNPKPQNISESRIQVPSEVQLALLTKLQNSIISRNNHLPTASSAETKAVSMMTPNEITKQVQLPQQSDQPVLRLPLGFNKASDTEVMPKCTPSPPYLASCESVEFTQSTVDNILQPNNSKFDSQSESALPLKKRKLLAYQNELPSFITSKQEESMDIDSVVDLTINSKKDKDIGDKVPFVPLSAAESLAKSDSVEKSVPMPQTTKLVSIDPRTSLMLLNEMQMALHQDEDGDIPLHIAVAQENVVQVHKYIHLMSISGKSVDKYNKDQQTPLHIAVELKFVDSVRLLLMAGANPNLVNKRGENAIHLAVKVESQECLNLMINNAKLAPKPDLNTRNFEGLTPLHTAVIKKNRGIVKMLIRAGADINVLDGKSGRTPIFYAVEQQNIKMVELFQHYMANIEITNYAGVSVIMAAQARGYQDIATMLLKGFDNKSVDYRDKESCISKKVPLPRIPSKSHLIDHKIRSSNPNSDSNDSLSNLNLFHNNNKKLDNSVEQAKSSQDLGDPSRTGQSVIQTTQIKHEKDMKPLSGQLSLNPQFLQAMLARGFIQPVSDPVQNGNEAATVKPDKTYSQLVKEHMGALEEKSKDQIVCEMTAGNPSRPGEMHSNQKPQSISEFIQQRHLETVPMQDSVSQMQKAVINANALHALLQLKRTNSYSELQTSQTTTHSSKGTSCNSASDRAVQVQMTSGEKTSTQNNSSQKQETETVNNTLDAAVHLQKMKSETTVSHTSNTQHKGRKLANSESKGHKENKSSGPSKSGSSSRSNSNASSLPEFHHLTNISKSTASILAAKLQASYSAKGKALNGNNNSKPDSAKIDSAQSEVTCRQTDSTPVGENLGENRPSGSVA